MIMTCCTHRGIVLTIGVIYLSLLQNTDSQSRQRAPPKGHNGRPSTRDMTTAEYVVDEDLTKRPGENGDVVGSVTPSPSGQRGEPPVSRVVGRGRTTTTTTTMVPVKTSTIIGRTRRPTGLPTRRPPFTRKTTAHSIQLSSSHYDVTISSTSYHVTESSVGRKEPRPRGPTSSGDHMSLPEAVVQTNSKKYSDGVLTGMVLGLLGAVIVLIGIVVLLIFVLKKRIEAKKEVDNDEDMKSDNQSEYEIPGTTTSSLSIFTEVEMSPPPEGVNQAVTWDPENEDDLYRKECDDNVYEDLDYATMERR